MTGPRPATEVRHLTPVVALPSDISVIPLPTPWPIGPINAYVLRGSPLTLVDTGPRTPEALTALEAGLVSAGVSTRDIELIVLTHQHPDHVGNAGEIARRSGARVAAFGPLIGDFADLAVSLERQRAYMSILMARHGMSGQELETLARRQGTEIEFTAPVDIGIGLSDGDLLDAGDRTFRVLHRPGHSPSDLVFFDEADGLLITGDHLLPAISSNPLASLPPGAVDAEEAAREGARSRPLIDYLESLRLTRELDVLCALPGHGPVFAGTRGLIEQRTRHHEERAGEIHAHLAHGPATARTLVDALWRSLPEDMLFLAVSEVLAHLDVLEARGGVEQVGGARVSFQQVSGPRPTAA
jgi:glyoxylase-like metal-dependent hydrolase (beta-lactamase superfamily II)